MTRSVLRIDSSQWTALLLCEDGKVIEAPPFLHWTLGSSEEEIVAHWKRFWGFNVARIPAPSEEQKHLEAKFGED